MALEAAFRTLCADARALHDALAALRTTILEDRPLRDDVVLVDILGDAAEEALGWLEEALEATVRGQRAAEPPVELDQARWAMAAAQDRVNRIARRFWTDLASYQRIAELTRLARERGGEWRAWARSVKKGLDQCQQSLFTVHETLSLCWQEMTERMTPPALPVQVTGSALTREAAGVLHMTDRAVT
jgi:hypothetical protein